jgi:hypothetical protein
VAFDDASPIEPSFISTQPLSATVFSVSLRSPVVSSLGGMSTLVQVSGGPMVPRVFQAVFDGSRCLTVPVPLSNHSMFG